ncbi:MAG: transposase [Mycobacterium sp.]
MTPVSKAPCDGRHTSAARPWGPGEVAAVEALSDPDVVAFIPDPKSRSGKSHRFIGYSPTADRVLVVVVVDHGGQDYGANCWPANLTDQRTYRERNEQ